MGDVVPFKHEAKPEETSYLEGDAYCNGCGHTWEAVAPVGAPESAGQWGALECPSCHAHKGVFRKHAIYGGEGVMHWHCEFCRGVLFSITLAPERHPMLCCANCGNVSDLTDAL